MKIQQAAIVVIGNEILSGRTTDKNIPKIASGLYAYGVDLCEVRIIADQFEAIIETVRNLSSMYNYVFTTGGIGPTHDDITAEAIARAFNREYDLHPEADQRLRAYYAHRNAPYNAGRQRMAKMPLPCTLIDNTVSGAPGFRVENVFVLPGVPHIMAKMFDDLLASGQITAGNRWHTQSVTLRAMESEIAPMIADIEQQHEGLQLGSYPREIAPQEYQVTLILRHRQPEALQQAFDRLLAILTLENIVCITES